MKGWKGRLGIPICFAGENIYGAKKKIERERKEYALLSGTPRLGMNHPVLQPRPISIMNLFSLS